MKFTRTDVETTYGDIQASGYVKDLPSFNVWRRANFTKSWDPEYGMYSYEYKEERPQLKEDCKAAKGAISFGSCPTSPMPNLVTKMQDLAKAYGANKQKQETETEMLYNKEQAVDIQQKNYLAGRANEIFYDLRSKMRGQFHMDAPDSPSSPKELYERLTKGEFTVEKADSDKSFGWDSWTTYFSWRTQPRDEVGYRAARKLLDKALTETKDAIIVKDAEGGLEALKAFEAKTFQ